MGHCAKLIFSQEMAKQIEAENRLLLDVLSDFVAATYDFETLLSSDFENSENFMRLQSGLAKVDILLKSYNIAVQ